MGTVWKHFWLSQLGIEVPWHPGGRGPDAAISPEMLRAVPPTKDHPAHCVNRAKAEKLCVSVVKSFICVVKNTSSDQTPALGKDVRNAMVLSPFSAPVQDTWPLEGTGNPA